jgi:hypothetical protein
MAEVLAYFKCNSPYLSYNAAESSENLSEHCMEIKTLLLNVLNELSDMKSSGERLLKEIWRSKVGVTVPG